MYKTIRHGENSLQYTILPQNDDFRIEGKLSNASCQSVNSSSAACTSFSNSSGGDKRSTSTGAPRRRRTFFAYLGLIFVCTVIIGAVLIPFLVSAECLPSPSEWFLKTKAVFTHSADRQQARLSSGAATSRSVAAAPPVAALLGQNVGKTVQIVNHNGIEQFILKVNKTMPASSSGSSSSSSISSSSRSAKLLTSTSAAAAAGAAAAVPPPLATTRTIAASEAEVTTTTTIFQTTEQEALIVPATTVRSFLVATTAATAAVAPPLNRVIATLTTRIIQVPLLKSAAKKPIMPPVLAKAQSTQFQQQTKPQPPSQEEQQQHHQGQTSSNIGESQNKSNNSWMNTRWAYIDPSTYVQWSGYNVQDSVLLPALLGFALIGMILIITVCLVARNKRTIVSSVRKRNRNDIEEQGAEDNATLLTTTNLSDDD